MADPTTPGQEGPSHEPPQLPLGWIAQYDATSKKYYFVEISSGRSQWDVPTQAAATPTPAAESPFQQPGTQSPYPQPGQQPDGPSGERGLGQMAMNQLMGGGGHSNKQSNPLLNLAGQFIGGGKQHGSSSGGSGGMGGLVGGLASTFMSAGKQTSQQQQTPQNYSGAPVQGGYGGQQHGAGGLMGKLGGMLGGSSHSANNYGYSQGGNGSGGYTGQAPPTSYQPPSTGAYDPNSQHSQQAQQPSYSSPPPHGQQQSYSSPPPQGQQPAYGSTPQGQQPAYGSTPQSHQQPYGQQQPAYGAPPQHGTPQQYGAPPQQYPPQQIPQSYGSQPYSQTPSYGAPPQQQYGQQPPYGHTGNLESSHHGPAHQGGLFGNNSSHAPPPNGNKPPGAW